MKIIIIGNMGSGKSTLAKKIRDVTQLPLLQLDTLWHATDYCLVKSFENNSNIQNY